MILDTCFIIDVMNEDSGAVDKLHDLISKQEPLIVTSITIFELFSGLSQSKRPINEKHKIINTLRNMLINSLDEVSAEKAGIIDGDLIKKGSQITPLDVMIAGITLNKNETLLTRNIKDFNKIKGLEIETY